MTNFENDISFQAAKANCYLLATNVPGKATYDCVVVGTGTKKNIFSRPYFAQRRETALQYGNHIWFDPKARA